MLASFKRIEKEEKAEKRKSMGRLIAFYDMEKREKQGKKLDYEWTQKD